MLDIYCKFTVLSALGLHPQVCYTVPKDAQGPLGRKTRAHLRLTLSSVLLIFLVCHEQ